MKIFLYYSVLLVFLFITASLQDGLQVMSFTCSENDECAEGECCLEGKCEELDECKAEDYSAENKSNTWVIYVVAFGTLFLILLPTFIIACCCCCAASALHRPAKESAHINQPGPAVITKNVKSIPLFYRDHLSRQSYINRAKFSHQSQAPPPTYSKFWIPTWPKTKGNLFHDSLICTNNVMKMNTNI